MGIFRTLLTSYFRQNPQALERLTHAVIDGLIEHVAPTTIASLTGGASAPPLAALPGTSSPVLQPFGASGAVQGASGSGPVALR